MDIVLDNSSEGGVDRELVARFGERVSLPDDVTKVAGKPLKGYRDGAHITLDLGTKDIGEAKALYQRFLKAVNGQVLHAMHDEDFLIIMPVGKFQACFGCATLN